MYLLVAFKNKLEILKKKKKMSEPGMMADAFNSSIQEEEASMVYMVSSMPVGATGRPCIKNQNHKKLNGKTTMFKLYIE